MAFNPYYAYSGIPQMMPNYQQPQSSNGNIIPVPSEMVARNYPLAPGTSGTFINENEPYCYTKTMGLNQFDRPVFKRYRLVEETEPIQNEQSATTTSEATDNSITIPDKINADITVLRALYDELKLDVEIIKEDISNAKSVNAKSLTSE